jgi:hypothetical protein
VSEVVDALVARMAATLARVEADGDPARFFLGTYLRTTVAVGAALDRGVFEDGRWVARWDVDFAELYLDALDAFRADPTAPAQPWRLAFGADPGLPPEAHVLLGMNAHINYDLPQSLVAARVAREDVALQRAGGRRTPLDRLLAPANRQASRLFLRESRRKVWANTAALHAARLRGPEHYAARLADLETASATRVRDLLRPGPVLLRLAVRGFGVELPAA